MKFILVAFDSQATNELWYSLVEAMAPRLQTGHSLAFMQHGIDPKHFEEAGIPAAVEARLPSLYCLYNPGYEAIDNVSLGSLDAALKFFLQRNGLA